MKKAIKTLPFLLATAPVMPLLAQDVLVYTGDSAVNQGYTNFGVATGKLVVEQAVLPADLSDFACVVLPVNQSPFSDATLDALDTYVNAGGRVLAIAEWSPFAGGIANMNALASHVGADLAVISADIDLNFHTTNNIDPSPFTIDVNSIRYAATSEVQVAVGPHAHSLVRSVDTGTTFIGVDKIGSGVFALFGDSNVLSDSSDDGYINHDNGVLAANFCDQAGFDIEVAIDVKPNSYPSSYGCKAANGSIPVAILSDGIFSDFDAATVDVDSVRFGKTGTEAAEVHRDDFGNAKQHLEDVNKDGLVDLVLHFRFGDTDFGCDDIPEGEKAAYLPAKLTGETLDGTPIVGEDILRLVGK
jgi:hypothetical protein